MDTIKDRNSKDLTGEIKKWKEYTENQYKKYLSLFEFFFSLFEFYILHKRPGK